MIQNPVDLPLSASTERVLKMGLLEAHGMKSEIMDTEHILLAILKEKNNLAANVLNNEGVQWETLRSLFYEKNTLLRGLSLPTKKTMTPKNTVPAANPTYFKNPGQTGYRQGHSCSGQFWQRSYKGCFGRQTRSHCRT